MTGTNPICPKCGFDMSVPAAELPWAQSGPGQRYCFYCSTPGKAHFFVPSATKDTKNGL